jgi:hypothetical protein
MTISCVLKVDAIPCPFLLTQLEITFFNSNPRTPTLRHQAQRTLTVRHPIQQPRTSGKRIMGRVGQASQIKESILGQLPIHL